MKSSLLHMLIGFGARIAHQLPRSPWSRCALRAVVVALTLATMSACSRDAVSVDLGGVSLRVSSSASTATITTWRVTITGPSGRQERTGSPGGTIEFAELLPGSYTVVLDGFEGSDLASQGVTNVTVQAGAQATATVTLGSILPVVTVVATDPSAAELGSDPGTFTISRSGPASAALTVPISLTGSATAGVDYQIVQPTVMLAAGQRSASVVIVPVQDTIVEDDETVVLTLLPNVGYSVGTPSSATVVIANAPMPSVTVTALDSAAAEAGPVPGTFRISRTGPTTAALSVAVTLSGTATVGVDYTAIASPRVIPAGAAFVDVTVTPVLDALVEGAETVVLTVAPSGSYTVGTPASATVTIADAPVVTIVATDSSASEVGPDLGSFTLSRTGPTTTALTVTVAVTGTATPGSDYTAIAATQVIPAGAASVAIVVTPLADALVEGNETVVLTVAANAAYAVGTPSTAMITITDTPLRTIRLRLQPGRDGVVRTAITVNRAGGAVRVTLTSNALSGPVVCENTLDQTLDCPPISIAAGASVQLQVDPALSGSSLAGFTGLSSPALCGGLGGSANNPRNPCTFSVGSVDIELFVNVQCIYLLNETLPPCAGPQSSPLGDGFGDEQFADIPAGSYSRGSTNGGTDELPVRTISISAFSMQKTEVTQGQWRQVMAGTGLANPSFFTACGDTCPVERVSWLDIQDFLSRLNQQDPGKGYRLPTEAEWEYATRAGTTGDYNVPGQPVENLAWLGTNSQGRTWPVAQKLPNGFGLFDTHGNVFEWVSDWYSQFTYETSPSLNPIGPVAGSFRVARGGSWFNAADALRSANRDGGTPDFRGDRVGFRLARGGSASSPALGDGFGPEQFATIPAGTYARGSTNGDPDEQPVRNISISAFALQRTEVTQGQWRGVMAGTALVNPSFFTACGDTCPVETVSWDDIQQFLTRLNQQDPGKNYRLPTEAEWEYAARAGTNGDYGGNGVLNDMGWWSGNSSSRTHPAARKLANAFGLFDMHGNVWEWVNDWYSATYYTTGPTVNPSGPTSGSVRVLRGGSWFATAFSARSADRNLNTPSGRSIDYGFRLARNP